MNRYAAGGLLALAAAVMWIGSAANDKKVDTLGPPPVVPAAPCPDCKPDKKPKPWGESGAPVGVDDYDPRLAVWLPEKVRLWFRNNPTGGGCIAADTPIDTPKGMVDICLLVPEKHAIYYHAADGTTKTTHNYKVFKTKTVKTLLRLKTEAGVIMLTADHKVAVLDDPDDAEGSYRWVEAGKLNLNEVDYQDGIDVWDITVNEKCFGGEGNFIANGMYVHNSCVQASGSQLGADQNIPAATTLMFVSDYGPPELGGGYPERTAKYAASRGIRIFNITGQSSVDWIKWACATGRGAAVGLNSSHFQSVYGYSAKTDTFYCVDNNRPSVIYELTGPEFLRRHEQSGRWCWILDSPPAPRVPVVRRWW